MQSTTHSSPISFEDFKSDPSAATKRLRGLGPVVYLNDIDRWVITHYAAVKDVLRSDLAASGDGNNSGLPLINRNGPRHRTVRRGVNNGISATALEVVERHLRNHTRTSIQRSLVKPRIDGVADLANPVVHQMYNLLFASTFQDHAARPRWNESIVTHGWLDERPPSALQNMRRALARTKRQLIEPTYADYQEVKSAVAEHFVLAARSSQSSPLTRELLTLHDSGAIDKNELIGIGLEFVFATSEAPAATISGVLRHLSSQPDRFNTLRSEPDLIKPFIEEVLRFESPGQWLRRVALGDMVVADQLIPKGSFILNLISSANRDESVFQSSDSFVPDRAPNPHLAFGFGPHACPGAQLTRLQARIFVEELLTQAQSIERVAPIHTDQYQWRFAIRSLARLELSLR